MLTLRIDSMIALAVDFPPNKGSPPESLERGFLSIVDSDILAAWIGRAPDALHKISAPEGPAPGNLGARQARKAASAQETWPQGESCAAELGVGPRSE